MIAEIPAALRLERVGGQQFRAGSIGDPAARGTVFGGQLLAQMILASDLVAATDATTSDVTTGEATAKEVASIHAVFTRAAAISSPLEIDVDRMHDGRTVASDTVTVRQGERLCARALLLRRSGEPDLIRHQPVMPEVAGPDAATESSHTGLVAPGTDVRVVDGVDTWDPDAPTGPAELAVWIRLPAGWGDQGLNQALLAYATDGFLIGTIMRPHAGIGQNMAHQSVATGVLTHTLTFHEPTPAGQWLLMAHEGTWAGRGRGYGRAHVFTESGTLVASFVQENMIRDGERRAP